MQLLLYKMGQPVILDYFAIVEPGQSHVIILNTGGIAKAEMLGIAYTYSVSTSDGASQIGSVSLLYS